jgi:hypothetical protein
LNVWYSIKGIKHDNYGLEYPYKATSPSLRQTIEISSINDVYKELVRCYDEALQGGYKVGEALYSQHFFFTNPRNIVNNISQTRIKEFQYCKLTQTPPYSSISKTPALYIDDIMIINEEINANK